ncbi:MAG TPA: FkbM family methyltransferase [Solirubrobacteraceae bacterium]|nr:FkbM family methyltransferase [Solirubrobacteraceae bacterium]
MRFYKRAIGAASRRLGRPELLAVVDAGARQAQRDELAISAILASSLPGDGTYVDVGTNRGQILGEAVRIAPRGHHVAFEPVPSLAEEVARSFPQVDCRPLALGASKEVTRFCHFTLLDGWSGLRRHPTISDAQGRPEYIDVEVSTLDDEVGEMTPKVIKIDVEGAELAVLEGGRSLLARARPIVIFEHVPEAAAMYGDAPEAPWDVLAELGYRVFSVTGEGPFTRSEFSAGGGTVNWLATPDP